MMMCSSARAALLNPCTAADAPKGESMAYKELNVAVIRVLEREHREVSLGRSYGQLSVGGLQVQTFANKLMVLILVESRMHWLLEDSTI